MPPSDARDLYLDLTLAGHEVRADQPKPGELWIGDAARLPSEWRERIKGNRDDLLAHARQANATEAMQAETMLPAVPGAGEAFPFGDNSPEHPDGPGAALLAKLRGRGITVTIKADDRTKLTVDGTLTDEDRASIREHKALMLAELELAQRRAEEAKAPQPFCGRLGADGDDAGAAGLSEQRLSGDDGGGVGGDSSPPADSCPAAAGATGEGVEAPVANADAGGSPVRRRYRGYVRPDDASPWSMVCEIEGLWECWKGLAAFRHPTSATCEKIVLPTGGIGPEIVLPAKRRRA